ncbi:MAG TPA: hypothetical protein DCO75_04585 [Fibrobacteres bacterium]|nr:hypothetical protein [Fibrobacterota bacterium]
MLTEKKNYDRLAQVKSLLAERNCSHILVTDMVDSRYISGFRSSGIFLLISTKKNLMFTDFRYKEAAQAHCAKNTKWQFIMTPEGGFSAISKYCKSGSVVGIQSDSLSVDQFDKLKHIACIRFVKLSDSVANLLVPKSAEEIGFSAEAARIGDMAFERTIKKLKTGMTEQDAAYILEDYCRRAGSEKPSFDTIALFGSRSAMPHGRPSATMLKKGDFVLFDFGCTVNGFASDMTRTVVMGEASAKQRAVYAIVEHAQHKAREAVKEGVAACYVDSCARDVVKNAGYGQSFGHATGHGVGLRIHEAPRISAKNKAALPVGALITIEPGIYIPDFGGVRIEDMVVVRKECGEILTHAPRHLIEINN